jgi:hypothetical protein
MLCLLRFACSQRAGCEAGDPVPTLHGMMHHLLTISLIGHPLMQSHEERLNVWARNVAASIALRVHALRHVQQPATVVGVPSDNDGC